MKRFKALLLSLSMLLLISIVYGTEYSNDFHFNSTPISFNKTLQLSYLVNNSKIIITTTDKFINLQNTTYHNKTNVDINLSFDIDEPINTTDTTYIYYYDNDVLDFSDVFHWNYYYHNLTEPPVFIEFKQTGQSSYTLALNQSILPYSSKYTHLIEAPAYSNISIVCDGFLKCPTEYKMGNATKFNLTFDISVPSDAYGSYVDYIVLISDNKIVKITWNFDIYSEENIYSYTVTEEDIAKCVTETDKSLIECINELVNKSSATVINRTVYKNNTIYEEVVIPVVKFDYDTVQKLIGDREATDAAIQQMAAERDIKESLEGEIAALKAQMETYRRDMESEKQSLNDERALMEAEMADKDRKVYNWFGIAGIILALYFVINKFYMTKTYTSHSLGYEIYWNLRRLI